MDGNGNGNRLAFLRQTKTNMSQTEFAKKFFVAQNSVSQWESGKRAMCADRLIIFADFFDVSIDYLVGRSSVEKQTAEPSTKVIDLEGSDSAQEKQMLHDFRALSDGHKVAVLSLISSLLVSEHGNVEEKKNKLFLKRKNKV